MHALCAILAVSYARACVDLRPLATAVSKARKTQLTSGQLIVHVNRIQAMAMDAPPQWVEEHRLKKVGLYYEGYVDDIDLVRQQHQAYSVSTFGIRRSWANNATTGVDNHSSQDQGKENKVYKCKQNKNGYTQ